ncbi:MAG TPA: DUF2510 domain-containing protein [Acidimicrobiales bacterium]|nr:DUF2510 domain-containing protein [Acidimicrobiales bacterium]
METTSTPGWYTDPTGRHEYRYWTGSQWSSRVADSQAEVLNPTEALAEATAPDESVDLLPPDHVPTQSPTWRPRGRRRPRRRRTLAIAAGAVLALVAVAAVVLVVLDPGEVVSPDDPGSPGSSGSSPPEPDDPLTAAVAGYVTTTSAGAVDGADAGCMAESIVDTVGTDRLTEVGVLDGADLLTALNREEVQSGLPVAMECLDDATVEALIAATLKPTVLERLDAESPQCLVRGWMDGFGRERFVEIYALWASGASAELTTFLDPDELGTLGRVVAECKGAG